MYQQRSEGIQAILCLMLGVLHNPLDGSVRAGGGISGVRLNQQPNLHHGPANRCNIQRIYEQHARHTIGTVDNPAVFLTNSDLSTTFLHKHSLITEFTDAPRV